MKILLLNQAFYPDVVSSGQHLSDLALGLVSAGHGVTVLTSASGYDDPSKRFPKRELWRGVEIQRISSLHFGKGSKLRRALDFGSLMVHYAWRLLFMPRFDVVIALTSPPLISFLGALFTRLKGGRFVFWSLDLNPDEAIAAGWLREDSLVARLLQQMLLYSLTQAGVIVALDRFMKARIAAKGIDEKKIEIVAPWSHDDAVHFNRDAREEFRSLNGVAERFVVMYSGNHSPCHPLETLIDAARELRGDDSIRFLFVGGGSEQKKVRGIVDRERLPNVVILPYQPREMLAGSLSAADLHVVVMGEPFVGMIHPCKIYNVLLVGAPVLYIGPLEGHVPDLVQGLPEDSPVFMTQHGDVAAVVKAIRSAQSMPRRSSREEEQLARQFSQAVLLPKIVAAVTRSAGELNVQQ